jgi:hypothetical protein
MQMMRHPAGCLQAGPLASLVAAVVVAFALLFAALFGFAIKKLNFQKR